MTAAYPTYTTNTLYADPSPNRYFHNKEADTPPRMTPFHWVVQVIVPLLCIVVPLTLGTLGKWSWWIAAPAAIFLPAVYIITASFINVGIEMARENLGGKQRRQQLAAAGEFDNTQLVTPATFTARQQRLEADRECYTRRAQPDVSDLGKLHQYNAQQWWQRKARTSQQLAELPAQFHAYSLTAQMDHYVAGPTGIFAIHDLDFDGVTVEHSDVPATDHPPTFGDYRETVLAEFVPTSTFWADKIPPVGEGNAVALNGLPWRDGTALFRRTFDDAELITHQIIPASAVENFALDRVLEQGIDPAALHVVLVAHGATMDNPVERVELRCHASGPVLGNAWLVHPTAVAEFITNRTTTLPAGQSPARWALAANGR